MTKYIVRNTVISILIYPLLLVIVYFDISSSFSITDYILVFLASLLVGFLLSFKDYFDDCVQIIASSLAKHPKDDNNLQFILHHFMKCWILRWKVRKDINKFHDFFDDDMCNLLLQKNDAKHSMEPKIITICQKYSIPTYILFERIVYRYSQRDARTSIEKRMLIFAARVQPNWLHLDHEFLVHLYQSFPKGYSFARKTREGRVRLLAKYKYLRIPPFWFRNQEWVVENGEPFCFLYQKYDPIQQKVDYVFGKKELNREVTVSQSIPQYSSKAI